ncbi:hypothetical protein HYH03_001894 [Edaphochlamys debaryana]|uniref:Uncharacterized protein n=1 Tax=Edaphochlamys debaryana TaxID=47281 RepID=A0A835YFK9_9CHLO|nr:hypothetical protein HYH03_001894 [Edaphochlamys debaryana]|eukprot:KAG2500318.1 hypothetical protein HYH03_001894 [Edaphochlamys debaryana]
MSQDDLGAIRQAVTAWHEKLLAHPATSGCLANDERHSKGDSVVAERVTVAADALVVPTGSCVPIRIRYRAYNKRL